MRNIEFRLSLILTKEDMKRLKIKERDGVKEITIDLHRMSCSQAKRFINNIINLVRESCRLILIHGYNHGTALKDMIRSDIENSHIEAIMADAHNLGRTDILLAT